MMDAADRAHDGGGRSVLVYSDALAGFDFGPGHPFKPARARQMMDLLERWSLTGYDDHGIVAPPALSDDTLAAFHDPAYLDLFRRSETGAAGIEMLEAGLGTEDCPVVPGIYDFCATASGGTYTGAMMLLADEARAVFNPLGGFHHAGRAHAEGFCYLNDIAVAIAEMTRRGRRVACVDIDVHFGNGTRDAFADRSDVLTVSLHESGATLYPWSGFQDDIGEGNGRGFTVNIPLLQGSDDEVYLYAFGELVPPLLTAFRPDIVVGVLGADTHRDDPLGNLNLTSNGYERVVSVLNGLSPKLLALGAGGYDVHRTAALWTLAWAAICGREPSDAFAGLVGGMMYGPEARSGSLRDAPRPVTGALKDRCMEHAREVVDYLRRSVFPIHGITG